MHETNVSARGFARGLDSAGRQARRMAWLRLMAVAVFGVAVVVGLASCGGNGKSAGQAVELETVRGMVLEVEAESLISLAALEVEDDAGKVWRFEGRGKVVPGFTPSHLNEHKLLGQSVEVSFYREDGREDGALVIHDIID